MFKFYSKQICLFFYLFVSTFSFSETELPGSWQPAPQLGNAYISREAKSLKRKCVTGKIVDVGQTVGEVILSTNASFEAITSAFSASASASAGVEVPLVKMNAAIEYAREYAATNHRINWFLAFNAVPKSRAFDNDSIKVSEQGKEILEKRAAQVEKMCGDEFIYQVDYGAQLIATMSIDFASLEDKKNFELEVGARIDYLIDSTDIKAKIGNMKKIMGSRTSVKVKAYQIGGDPSELGGILSSEAVNCSLEKIEDCQAAFGKVIDYAKGAFRNQLQQEKNLSEIRYRTAAYGDTNAFDLEPADGFTPLDKMVLLKRKNLNKQFKEQSINYQRAQYILQHLKASAHRESLRIVAQIEQQALANMQRLTEALSFCFDNPNQECVDQNITLESYDESFLEVEITNELDPNSALGRLFLAVKENDVKKAHQILASGGGHLLHQEDPQGYNAFHRAIQQGNCEIINFFLEQDPKKNSDNSLVNTYCNTSSGETPLCLAAQLLSDNANNIIEVFCNHGANILGKSKANLSPMQCAVIAGNSHVIAKLLEKGASLDECNDYNESLAHLAVSHGQLEMLNDILLKNPNMANSYDHKGNGPLHMAAGRGDLAMVKLLLDKGAFIKAANQNGELPLDCAIRSGHKETIEALGFPSQEELQKLGICYCEKVNCLSYMPNSSKIVIGSNNGICLWDVKARRFSDNLLQTEALHATFCLHGSDSPKIAMGDDYGLYILDVKSGDCERWIKNGRVCCLSCSSNGLYVVTGHSDGSLNIWTTTLSMLRTMEGHSDMVRCLSCSPDGSHIISGSDDKTIGIWDAKGGKCVGIMKGHTGKVLCLSYSPDGFHIASGSDDKTIRVWDTKNRTCLKTLHEGFAIYCLSYSPNGMCIASGASDGIIRIWDAKKGDSLRSTENGHSHVVTCLSYSPDGSHIASGSYDGTIRIWDAGNPNMLHSVVKSRKPEVVPWVLAIDPLVLQHKNRLNETALEYAERLGYGEMVEAILEWQRNNSTSEDSNLDEQAV